MTSSDPADKFEETINFALGFYLADEKDTHKSSGHYAFRPKDIRPEIESNFTDEIVYYKGDLVH